MKNSISISNARGSAYIRVGDIKAVVDDGAGRTTVYFGDGHKQVDLPKAEVMELIEAAGGCQEMDGLTMRELSMDYLHAISELTGGDVTSVSISVGNIISVEGEQSRYADVRTEVGVV